jgi:hypothetical protein
MRFKLLEALLQCQGCAEILKLAKFDGFLKIPIDLLKVKGEQAALQCNLRV